MQGAECILLQQVHRLIVRQNNADEQSVGPGG